MMSREITQIIIHCSATYATQDINASDIDRWHKEKGWSGCGYHFVILRSGAIQIGRDIQKPGAHAKGFNRNSIGVCLVGGLDDAGDSEDNFTFPQYESLRSLIALRPGVEVLGHRDLPGVDKECPCFDVKSWLK